MRRSKTLLLFVALAALFLSSCSHGISIYDAASGGKAKCGKNHLK